MVDTASTMTPLGTPAPDFSLPDTEGNIVSRDDFDDAPALLIMFLSNHCPYVKHVRSRLAELTREYMAKGVAVVGINSNDVDAYPPTTLQSAWQRRSSGWVTRFRTCSTRASR